MRDNITAAEFMQNWTKTISASSEDDVVDALQDMQRIDDANEAGVALEQVLGYNPITFYDKRDLEKYYENILERAPSAIQDVMKSRRDEIIDRTMKNVNDCKPEFYLAVLVNTIAETTGYIDPELKNVANLTSFENTMNQQFESFDLDLNEDDSSESIPEDDSTDSDDDESFDEDEDGDDE
jgi:hypothetical protein